jgi:tRNA (Thr-GGU) A37 N-methylase
MTQPSFAITPIGTVESPLTDPASAPNQGDEGAPDAWLVFEPAVVEALGGIQAGDEVLLLTWFHLARRDVLRVHPRGDVSRTPQGCSAPAPPTDPIRSGCTGWRSPPSMAAESRCATWKPLTERRSST